MTNDTVVPGCIEIDGFLKVTQMEQDDDADTLIVLLDNGKLGKRPISTLITEGHYIGELFGGGIVFHTYDNGQHGLIVNLYDLGGSSGISWNNGTNTLTGASSYINGAANTTTIISAQGSGTYGAQICADFNYNGYSDWVLPSAIELRELSNVLLRINNVLESDGNSTSTPIHIMSGDTNNYWSSTESNISEAITFSFFGVQMVESDKSNTLRVRAIRSF
ncbi:MAG: DUF1566 domain-containing protein [Saprospiraceae bacterium]